MRGETNWLENEVSDLSRSMSMFLSACQGASKEHRKLELDGRDTELMDCGAAFLRDVLNVYSFLTGKDTCVPEAEKLVAFVWVVEAAIEVLGKKGHPHTTSGIEGYVRSLIGTLMSISKLGTMGVDTKSIESARQFFAELANRLPGEIVEERARVIVQIPDELIAGLRRVAQKENVTASQIVARAIADRMAQREEPVPATRAGEWILHLDLETAMAVAGWRDRIDMRKEEAGRRHG